MASSHGPPGRVEAEIEVSAGLWRKNGPHGCRCCFDFGAAVSNSAPHAKRRNNTMFSPSPTLCPPPPPPNHRSPSPKAAKLAGVELLLMASLSPLMPGQGEGQGGAGSGSAALNRAAVAAAARSLSESPRSPCYGRPAAAAALGSALVEMAEVQLLPDAAERARGRARITAALLSRGDVFSEQYLEALQALSAEVVRNRRRRGAS